MSVKTVMTRIGWLLFLIGSVVFLADGIRLRDMVTAVGSALFVAGVVAFLVAERQASTCPLCGRTLTQDHEASPHATVELTTGSGVEFGEM
jgi:hypothetical protein